MQNQEKRHESEASKGSKIHGSKDYVTFEVINDIFSKESAEYHHIKEIAEKDIGKELISRIEKFLEDRKKTKVEEIKQIIFEDASKVADQNINDIVDAFVKMRSANTLDEVDSKSINDILILFNQWVAIGKGQQEKSLPVEFSSETEKKHEKQLSLEEELFSFRGQSSGPANIEQLYKTHSISPIQREIYSSESEVYASMGPVAEFISGEHEGHEHNHYKSRALYKIH
jgi:hypothetical protein